MADETPDLRASAADTLSSLPDASGEGGRILLATSRDYCADVDRAVNAVEKALDLCGAPVYVRKEIAHNKLVVEFLTKHGAIFVQETDKIPEGARIAFSTHDVPPQVHEAAKTRSLATIDVTCPLVTKVHREAARLTEDDYDIILVDHQGHEEVEGTCGETPSYIQVVGTPDEVGSVEVHDPERAVWISQTTLFADETRETANRPRQRFPRFSDLPSDDVCYATQNRQVVVKTAAPRADVMVVVGSANSSDSVRLVEVVLEAGAGDAHRVDRVEELKPERFKGAKTVGLASGAPVPEILVREVAEWLQARGFLAVEVVCTENETITFVLPRNLCAGLAERGLADAHPHTPCKTGPNHTR